MKAVGIFLFLNIVLSSSAWSQNPQPPVSAEAAELQSLLQLAKKKNLESSRQWQKLLHIERNAVGLKSSQIVDTEFFLAQGELADLSEFDATLTAFFANPERYEEQISPPIRKHLYKPDEKITDHSQHPICRFPARLKFMKDNLREQDEIWKKLPKVECTFQRIFLEALDAAKISYVFSSYYSDSPGSAFGHTFFRVQRKSNLKNQQELLDYGISYAANVTTSNGLLYALLGLVGGFSGTWANLPYYYKVREYNDFESRDLWSYELNLTPDEVEMFSYHMWEVGAHYYRYFFFTQNCSYQMLTALEAAAPRLELSDKVPFYYVIPSDSLKALFYDADLVSDVQFRPSLRKNFLARLNRLDEDGTAALAKFVGDHGATEGLIQKSDEGTAYALDAALDYMDLKYTQKINDHSSPEFRIKEGLLYKRAQLSFVSPNLYFNKKDQQDPSKSHGSSRMSFFATDKKAQYMFGYRFALHDLSDPIYGLPENSQIEFFNFKFLVNKNVYYLKKFQFFNVLNLNPLTFYDKKMSWGAEIGAIDHRENCHPGLNNCLLYGARARFGVSTQFQTGALNHYIWSMALGQIRYSHDLKDKYLFLSPGMELGFLTRFSTDLSLRGSLSREFPVEMKAFNSYDVELRRSFNNKWALSLQSEDELQSLGFFYYF